ncbi:MAG: ABC transporter permease subunit [Pseudomonadota bacterium]
MTDVTMQDGPEPKKTRPSVTYVRDKKTKNSVVWMDALAGRVISVGGLFVIATVFAIMFFLIWVAMPLFGTGTASEPHSYKLAEAGGPVISTSLDEYASLGLELSSSGHLTAFHAPSGKRVDDLQFDFAGATPSAFARTLQGDDIAYGFADGSVRLGSLAIETRLVDPKTLPQNLVTLPGGDRTEGHAIYLNVAGDQVRRLAPTLSLEAPVQVALPGAAIRFLDYRVGGTSERPTKIFASVDAAGTARLSAAFAQVNMMTGETSTTLENTEVPTGLDVSSIAEILLNTQGDRLLIVTKDGLIHRYDTRNPKTSHLAETTRILPAGVVPTALAFLNGENSLIVAGSDSSLKIWSLIDRGAKSTSDGKLLTAIHDFGTQKAPITRLNVSQRTRLFIGADAAGTVSLFHATSERHVLTFPDKADAEEVSSLMLAPRDNAVLAIGRNGDVRLWSFDVPHPETTIKTLFGKVWYEGYPEPGYTWQSTSGTDSAEPKLSLVPLIFGTIKGALYSLLFAVPIALLAAIYTAEFLHPRIRAIVKPTMELMASLPSVVIGFVVALVLSPIVENWIAAIVLAFGVVPLTLIGFAFLWQLLPQPLALRLDGIPKLVAFFIGMAVAIWVAVKVGPVLEYAFFGGDFKAWTSGAGSAAPFIFLLILPVTFLATFQIGGRILGAVWRDRLRTKPYHVAGAYELVRWVSFTVAALLLAAGLAYVLGSSGFDARGGIVDTYIQRNTLIASFGMAFAVIPIIYSIAEDALGAVPEHLRSASLGCGATKWQTAAWVILPTAGSGIFSAIMIGLGRAVGETMIVVMATGNTPILDWSLFNGLRALSANINVELPEAVKDSSLYRTLFLCGLVLFVMTFILNTFAEVVRQRFRKRAAQL